MKRFKMPSAFTILFAIIIVVAILTHIVPAGQYDYVDPEAAKKEPIPGTYHPVDPNPQGIGDIIMAPVKGFYDAVDVALFVIVIGGFLGIVMKTGAIDAGIAEVTRRLKGREKWMIPILMIFFGLGGTTYGMAEETIAFYPLLLPVFIAAGYDSITAASVILLGAGVGVLGSTVNPFATGIASGFAGISIGEGIGLRLLILIVGELATILFVMRYAERVRKDPTKSLVYDMMEDNKKHFLSQRKADEFPELTGRRKFILFLFALTFIIMVFGVIPFEDIGITAIPTLWWWFGELTALFLVSAIVIGLIAGLNEKELVSAFVDGARDLLGVALIIGVSRGITVVMNAGNITDTVLNLGERTLSQTGSAPFAILTYLFYIPLSFLIPSTSGLATLSMPIMAPLGDFANVARHIVITAYQSASGIVNLITPTSAVVMGGLAIARIPYNKWIKHVWKLLVILMIIIIAALSFGVLVG
ncbi:YfcC family protein [Thermohalobacter berrensis]|uniref:C4-dicarboxylate ABC transporter n=1 Tax=Thermohalobacter berrensis TaxID=99594 RepID=A0A419SUA2_9FIRM|nr:YfcC family protein [Thermohalobacter berrensis]RKD28785.1 C4-dicarboxylate ABC transporter [Thermohalobacter berrensis]